MNRKSLFFLVSLAVILAVPAVMTGCRMGGDYDTSVPATSALTTASINGGEALRPVLVAFATPSL